MFLEKNDFKIVVSLASDLVIQQKMLCIPKLIHHQGTWLRSSASCYIDIKKAFDSIDHKIFVGKLEHIGAKRIPCNCLNLTFKIDASTFGNPRNDTTVTLGVPQGSTLGPLLFLVHVNDITCVLNLKHFVQKWCNVCFDQTSKDITNKQNELIVFADNSTMTCCRLNMTSLEEKLENILEETYLWIDANKLVITVRKSCILWFSRVGTLHPEITVNVMSCGKVQWPAKGCAKYLGVIVNENLSFVPCIYAVELKLSRNLGIMKKLKHTFPNKTLILHYNALIKPHLQYCAMVWQSIHKMPWGSSNTQKIISCWNFCLSFPAWFLLSDSSLACFHCLLGIYSI